MRRLLLAAGLGAVAAIAVWYLIVRLDGMEKYRAWREPRVMLRPNQKMLVVEVAGDPHGAVREAMAVLFQHFYALKHTEQGLKLSAVRARWPQPPETPKEQWVGEYGLPIPENITALPYRIKALSPVRIELWEYGQVVEMLHQGSYHEIRRTADCLRDYVKNQGYDINGPQEEEYVRGPGLLFKGNPKNYLTIIRYQVEKREMSRYRSL